VFGQVASVAVIYVWISVSPSATSAAINAPGEVPSTPRSASPYPLIEDSVRGDLKPLSAYSRGNKVERWKHTELDNIIPQEEH
jgi:hypothetical protein